MIILIFRLYLPPLIFRKPARLLPRKSNKYIFYLCSIANNTTLLMLVKTFGSAIYGIDAIIITIEVNVSQGSKFFLVG